MGQQDFTAKDPFFFHTGQKAQSLQELLKIIKTLDAENFRLHVNDEKNDFAAWIRYSAQNSPLANRISALSDKAEIIKCINGYLGIKNAFGVTIPPKTVKINNNNQDLK